MASTSSSIIIIIFAIVEHGVIHQLHLSLNIHLYRIIIYTYYHRYLLHIYYTPYTKGKGIQVLHSDVVESSSLSES